MPDAKARSARTARTARTARKASRLKRRKGARRSELTRYGRVQWVPVQWVEPPHSVRYPHHLERLVRSMRRARSPSRGGCMWTGRPLLVERVDPGYRHPGIRYVAWTGSHRIAAAFAAGQWLVPILEIDKRCWDRAHGKPKTTRLSETYDDESRLARLLTTEDERAIRLMQREIPRADKDKKARAERQRAQLAKQAKDDALWKSLGENLQARVKAERGKWDLIEVRDKATREAFVFHKVVLEKLLETLRAETSGQGVQANPRRQGKAA